MKARRTTTSPLTEKWVPGRFFLFLKSSETRAFIDIIILVSYNIHFLTL
jgi:hypothetical protein